MPMTDIELFALTLHEAGHVSIGWESGGGVLNQAEWEVAAKKDNQYFITEYAWGEPNREDVSESYHTWFGCKISASSTPEPFIIHLTSLPITQCVVPHAPEVRGPSHHSICSLAHPAYRYEQQKVLSSYELQQRQE